MAGNNCGNRLRHRRHIIPGLAAHINPVYHNILQETVLQSGERKIRLGSKVGVVQAAQNSDYFIEIIM